MKKISDIKIFKKFRSLDQETRNIYFYGILFIFIISVALIMKLTPNEKVVDCSNKKEETVVINYQNILKNITNNYEEDITINKYYFNEYVNIKHQLEKEKINIKTINNNETYYIKENSLYKFIDNKYEIYNDKIFKETDTSFINPENILKLIDKKTYEKDNTYMIETSSWINLYNEINNTNLSKKITGEILLDFISYKNNELLLKIDLTNLYKNLDYEYENVIYLIKFKNINKVEIEEIN